MSLANSDDRRRFTGSQLVAGLAFVFLTAAIFAAVYFRITRVNDVSIGMVAVDQTTQTSVAEDVPETSAPATTVPAVEETTSSSFVVSTTAATTPPPTGVPLEGVLADGRVELSGSVPDSQTGQAFVEIIESFVGAGNVDEALTVEAGAEVPSSFTLQIVDNVLFDAGGETVSAELFPVLGQIVEFMKLDPNVTLVVEGHTDSTGTDVGNLALSQRRADAVRVYLADQGINEFRLEARGRGSSDPVADNGTEAGRLQNRRIEFQLVGFKVGTGE